MSKIVKFFAIAALVAGAFAMTPAPAAAQHYHGGGHWHGGGGHWHGGGGWGGSDPASSSALAPVGAGAAIPIRIMAILRRPALRLGARARLAPRPLGFAARLALLVSRHR